MRVFLDNCCYNRSRTLGVVNAERFIALTLREPQDYTAWRRRNMYLGESVHDVAERARAASRRYDDMHGDYTKCRETQFNESDETIKELGEKIKSFAAERRESAPV